MGARLPQDWVPAVARAQDGLFTVGQALSDGASRDQVRRRRRSGAWVVVAGDALALRDVPVDERLRARAARLTWPDAVVCLASAARVHGLPVRAVDVVHVNVPNRRAGRAGLVTHEMRLGTAEVETVDRVRVTNLRRTVFDCLGRLPADESSDLLAWVGTRDLTTADVLRADLVPRPFWWGNTARRAAATDLERGALSAAERRLHDILQRAAIHGWRGDQRVYDGVRLIARVDVLFDDVPLVLEIDGYRNHGRDAFQDDRERQNRLVVAGYTVLRFTWHDLVEREAAVVREVRRAIVRLTR